MLCSNDLDITAFSSIVSSSNVKDTWFFEGRCIKQGFVQSWSHGLGFTDTNRLTDNQRKHIRYLANDIEKLYKLPLKDFPAGKVLPYYSAWIDPEQNAYWELLKKKTEVKLNLVNGYYLGGWYDIFCEGTILDYQQAILNSDKIQRLVIGPWSHTDIFSHQVGEIDFGIYSFDGFDQYDIFKWFLNISRNEPTSAGAKIYIMGKNKWKDFTKWPPNSTSRRLYPSSIVSAQSLIGDGQLNWESASNSGVDKYCHLKSNPIPSIGGRSLDATISGRGGPKDQRQIESRKDVLVYTTHVIQSEITILGMVKAFLSVGSSQLSTVFHIKLVDVFPDELAINVLDSCKKIEFSSMTKQQIEIFVGTTAYTFLPNHRIRLEISSSCFPRINNYEDYSVAEVCQSLFWGASECTWLELPIIKL